MYSLLVQERPSEGVSGVSVVFLCSPCPINDGISEQGSQGLVGG